jgi:hypothetical protein
MPAANAQITSITDLYQSAQRAAQSLVAEASLLAQTPERVHVTNWVAANISLLQTFQKADGLRAKFLGFSVTGAAIKTFFLTLFTIGLGLWSVLRGAGIGFTVQSVCPIPS